MSSYVMSSYCDVYRIGMSSQLRSYDGANPRCSRKGCGAACIGVVPAGGIGASIGRTVPQAGCAGLRDHIGERAQPAPWGPT